MISLMAITTDNIYFLAYFVLLGGLSLFLLRKARKNHKWRLPPGPPGWPVLGNFLQVRSAKQNFQSYVAQQRRKYGDIFTIRLGPKPLIMVSSHALAHEALIQRGSLFACRPPAKGLRELFTSGQFNINSAPYGPRWRALRRNLVSETLTPAAISSFRGGREWGIEEIVSGVKAEASRNGGATEVVNHLRYGASCVLLYMCFGMRLEKETVKEVEAAMRDVLLSGAGLGLLDSYSALRFIYRKRWRMMERIRRRQEETLMPLIERRRAAVGEENLGKCRAYLDSLLSLTVDGGRKLSDGELVTLCSEFINAGTDTTSTTMQWVMANLVKHQHIQAKLYGEILATVGKDRHVEDEDLPKLTYLDAVVKETLRRHPPGKFVLTHAVTETCSLGGYDIPSGTMMNFCVWEMGNDESVWDNPSEFRPERFVGANVDMTGTKEIKMMPFGVGRRICPGLGLAMLHVELIVARLVQMFKWECKVGESVDMEEKEEFTVVMKSPLQALITERE